METQDKTPLTVCDYNSSGTLLAYAAGYEWSRGAEVTKEFGARTKIGIHYLTQNQRKINT